MLFQCRWTSPNCLFWCIWMDSVNTLWPRQNGRNFADNIFKWIFLNENVWILIKISLKFVPQGPINNIPALDQIMAWRRQGDKPLSGPMMVKLPTHICFTRPQWVKASWITLICQVRDNNICQMRLVIDCDYQSLCCLLMFVAGKCDHWRGIIDIFLR